MKRLGLVLIALLGTMVWAGEGHACTASAQDCLNKYVSYLKNTAWDGIHVEGLGDESKIVKVSEVLADSPGEKAGIKAGDVLVSMHGKTLAGMTGQDLEGLMKTIKIGDKVAFVVERNGQQSTYNVVMASVPDQTIATWVGKHMVKHHVQESQI
ncbi:MAG: PDZ domain-containing protein [Acidobacteria bacterium]|nr:PDZ domain-containing protein [Acidobacteriota bacterium]